MTTHLLRTSSATIDGDWQDVPMEYVSAGAPATRDVPLGLFKSGNFGFWEMTPGRAKGAGPAEVFVVLRGAGALKLTGQGPLHLEVGTICQSASDQNAEFSITEPLLKFYFSANEDAEPCGASASLDTSIELPKAPFFSEDQTHGKPVETWLWEGNSLCGANYGLWQMGPGGADLTATDEVFLVLGGSGTLRFPDGESFSIAAGSVVQTFEGKTYEWEVHETLRKFYLAPSV